MSAVPLTQDKCATSEFVTSQHQEGGDSWCKIAFKRVADEIREKRKFTKEKHTSRAKSLAHSQLCALLCPWRWSECGQILVWDMTLCFFWQLTQHPQAIVNTDGDLGQVQQTNGLLRPHFKDKYGSAGAKNKGEFQGKTCSLLCNWGKHLQAVDQATSSGKEKKPASFVRL